MLYRPPAGAAPDAELLAPVAVGLEWEAHDRDDNWLVSYADILSVVLAMVVLLFGRVALEAASGDDGRADGVVAAADAVVARADMPPREEPVTSSTIDAPTFDAAATPSTLATPAAPPALPLATEPPVTSLTESRVREEPEDRLAALIEQRFAGTITTARRADGLSLTIPEVALFDSARAVMQESAAPLLADLAIVLETSGDAAISVEGHTDDRPVHGGVFESNWDLGAARANAVTRYLLERGIAPHRLHSASYADTRPIADNGTPEGRAANRRVELEIEFRSDD